jgi:hypothetical protein
LSKEELIDSLAKELENASYDTVQLIYQAAHEIASVEKTNVGVHDALDHYVSATIKYHQVILRILSDMQQKK